MELINVLIENRCRRPERWKGESWECITVDAIGRCRWCIFRLDWLSRL